MVLLASSRWRPGMLLNNLQHTGQHPTSKNYLAENVSSAENEKPCYLEKLYGVYTMCDSFCSTSYLSDSTMLPCKSVVCSYLLRSILLYGYTYLLILLWMNIPKSFLNSILKILTALVDFCNQLG